MKFSAKLFILFVSLVFSQPANAIEPGDIVVSIAPLHSLVANITDGVVKPNLMLAPNKSPHNYVLKPSDAHQLANAKLIFWIGPQLENFLSKPIQNIAAKAKITTLYTAPYSQENKQDEHVHDDNAHIWLDPIKAIQMVKTITEALVKSDPINAQTYRANLARTIRRLEQLDRSLQKKLAIARAIYVFHNAYEQFADRYQIKIAGVLVNNPSVAPSAKKLKRMRDKLAASNARCIFVDPQTSHSAVTSVIEGTNTKIVNLDPLGINIPIGPDQYFTLLNNLGEAIASCNKN